MLNKSIFSMANVAKLGDLLSNVQLVKSQIDTKGKIVKISDLRESSTNFVLNIAKIELSNILKQTYEIRESALLIYFERLLI